MVSIIMPAYNASKTIRASIEAVLNQTFKEFELIIINDCSKDDTEEVIKEYLSDQRIIYLKNEENLGVALTRNNGLKNAKYNYIAFLDSDDLWSNNKLAIQLKYMQDNDLSFTITDYELINNEGKLLKKYIKSKTQSYQSLLRGSRIGCLTVMIDKTKINSFSFKKTGHEDYALWLEILRENKIKAYAINEKLAKHRITEGSLSSNKKRAIKWTWNIFRKEENKNIFISSYLLFRYGLNRFSKVKKIK